MGEGSPGGRSGGGHLLLHSVLVLLVLISFCPGRVANRPLEFNSDLCEQTIWDSAWEEAGVHNVVGTCSEGRVTWQHPHGALRVTLTLGDVTPLTACFRATSHFAITKISGETENSRGNPNLDEIVVLNRTAAHMMHEKCLRGYHGDVTLFLETISDLHTATVGVLDLEYDLQRDTHNGQVEDPMEECRPCTDQEILFTVCSSDFAVVGHMEAVFHSKLMNETEIRVNAKDILRQRHQVFRRSIADARSQDQGNSMAGESTTSDAVPYQGPIYTPHKCGIRRGQGEFMFIGRIRLRRAWLQCAPRIEDFDKLWRHARATGTNPCELT